MTMMLLPEEDVIDGPRECGDMRGGDAGEGRAGKKGDERKGREISRRNDSTQRTREKDSPKK